MFAKLQEVEKRYNNLNKLLSDPLVIAQQSEFQQYAREQSDLTPIVSEFRELKKLQNELEGNEKILKEETDEEILALARDELAGLMDQVKASEQRLKVMLLPKDPRDDRRLLCQSVYLLNDLSFLIVRRWQYQQLLQLGHVLFQ